MSYLNRVYDLWYFDLEARRRYQVLTILIAFGYGAFNSLALGRPEKRVTWETLGLICVLTVGFTLFYCFRKETRSVFPDFARIGDLFRNYRFLEVGLVSTVVLAIASLTVYVPNEKVQAASLDLRLRQALSSPLPFDSATIKQVTTVVRKATADEVPINPALVNAAGARYVYAPQQNPAAWHAALEILSYRSAWTKATESLPQRSCIEVGNATGIAAVITDSMISGCNQTLDYVSWNNVIFQNVTVVYRGGPAVLENVQFKNCRFILDDSAQARKLGQTLLASDHVTITLPD